MPEPKKPETEEPYFEITKDKVKVGQWEFEHSDFDVPIEADAEEGGENAAVEGEEVEDAEPVESETKTVPEQEPEEGEESAEEEAEEPEPAEPEKLKFQQKYKGEEYEIELTPQQIANRLQILRSYQEGEKEFWEQKKKVDTFAHIVESEAFQEWVKERRESGEQIPEPVKPSMDDEAMEFEIAKRRDPQVLIQLREWAMDNLTQEQIQILDNNPKVYIKEYDRIVQEMTPPPAPPPKEKVDSKVKEKILKSKEVVKERAAVEKPGVKVEQDPNAATKKRVKYLQRVMREGTPGQADDAALELAELLYFKPYEQ